MNDPLLVLPASERYWHPSSKGTPQGGRTRGSVPEALLPTHEDSGQLGRPTMKVMLGQIHELDEEPADFALQLGIDAVQFNTPILDETQGYWTYESLVTLKATCGRYGLTLQALENVPADFVTDIKFGGPNRDRQLDNYCRTIANMGRTGIPILRYNFARPAYGGPQPSHLGAVGRL
jgi:hypothetical protein